MNKLAAETLALLLMFAAFPIVSMAAMRTNGLLLTIGIACLVIGGGLPILTRYLDHSNDKIRDAGIEFDDRAS